jgi:tetratricopeptide (TPR) repeat protein
VRLIRIAGLAGALLLLAASSAAAADKSAAALWEAGKKAFADNKFAEAADLFERAWAIEKNVSFAYSVGSAFRRMASAPGAPPEGPGPGPTERAAIWYETYLAAVPAGERPDERPKAVAYAAELRLKLGVRLKEAGRCADAIGQFIKSLEHVPTAGAPWVYLGLCHEDVGNKDAARNAYEKALAAKDLDPAQRAAAEARLAALRPPAALDGAPPPESAKTHKAAPWGLIAGVGGGVVVVGVVTVLIVALTAKTPTVDVGAPPLGVMSQEGW